MGIRFNCPQGHQLHVKEHLAGKRGICPECGARVTIPLAEGESALASSLPYTLDVPAIGSASTSIPLADISGLIDTPEPEAVTSVPRAAAAVRPATANPKTPSQSFSVLRAQQRKRRKMQMQIAAGLLVLVVVLGIVLIWVLNRDVGLEVIETGQNVDTVERNNLLLLAVSNRLSARESVVDQFENRRRNVPAKMVGLCANGPTTRESVPLAACVSFI